MELHSLLILFITGLSAGFVDSIAGGGGLITLPVLLSFGLPPQVAFGTNKMQSSCGTALAVYRYHKARLVDTRTMAIPFAVTFVASLLGTWTVTRVPSGFLKLLVPWLLLAVAIYTLLSPKLGQQRNAPKMTQSSFALLAGSVLGFYDGFFGPGTGSFWTLACISLIGLDLPSATGYTKVVNLASNLASLLVFSLVGLVRPDIAAAMIGGQLVGSYLGSHLAIKHGATFIRYVFISVVVALVIRLMMS